MSAGDDQIAIAELKRRVERLEADVHTLKQIVFQSELAAAAGFGLQNNDPGMGRGDNASIPVLDHVPVVGEIGEPQK
jgi:hypothetical protein